jgi:hypothetical protein
MNEAVTLGSCVVSLVPYGILRGIPSSDFLYGVATFCSQCYGYRGLCVKRCYNSRNRLRTCITFDVSKGIVPVLSKANEMSLPFLFEFQLSKNNQASNSYFKMFTSHVIPGKQTSQSGSNFCYDPS